MERNGATKDEEMGRMQKSKPVSKSAGKDFFEFTCRFRSLCKLRTFKLFGLVEPANGLLQKALAVKKNPEKGSI